MRVSTDNDKCVGAGQCAMLIPDVFDQGDDGIVVLLQKEPAEDVHDDVRQAAVLCPSGSIHIAD
ncbi:ferredoxin [Streptomyces sp. NBC_00878]|uniref:ferredoxin n=1 Tax=Streptomyces sp. NBC_00878 TaxID=2975854 RepID=UPI00224F6B22|nr:ferredoxin [Streptomyces sp. NBC_00878]MCX4911483.1 ferredoxin [Streptomyces sp. NBC_00878]